MASDASVTPSNGNDDPPPYFRGPKDITGLQNDTVRQVRFDNHQDLRFCSACLRTCPPQELVYWCLKCRKIQDEITKKNNKSKDIKGSQDKPQDNFTKFEICQNCHDRGELCPNDNGDGKHELKAFILRGSVYRLYQSRTVLASDSDIVKCIKTENTTALTELGKNASGINSRDETGHTPLHIATKLGMEEAVKVLVDRGAFIEARNDDKASPLMLAMDYHYPSMISTLLDLGADPNGKGISFTPLHKAAALGNEEMVQALVAKKAIIDCTYQSMTPLMCACVLNRKAAARVLLDAGANPNLAIPVDNSAQQSSLTQVVLRDFSEMAQLLIKYGADIEAKLVIPFSKGHETWETPLTLAAMRNSVGVCRVLLDAGAHINRKCKRGWTPLSMAAHCGHMEVAKVLVDHGAVGDPTPYRKWKRFKFSERVTPDTKKAILQLVRSVKHSPKKG